MVRSQLFGYLALLALVCSGCATCCDIYDYAYPTFGGKYERTDPYWGRVGSIYSDPTADPGIPYSGEPRGEEIEPADDSRPDDAELPLPSPNPDGSLRLRPPDTSTDAAPVQTNPIRWR